MRASVCRHDLEAGVCHVDQSIHEQRPKCTESILAKIEHFVV